MAPRAVLLLLVGALLSGCIGGDGDAADACSCPNTEAIVADIDWLGDGTVANTAESVPVDGRPQVALRFSSFDDPGEPLAALNALVQRAGAAGLETSMPESSTAQIRAAEASAAAIASEPFRGEASLKIVVRISVADQHAADALQPFVDALGTIG